MLKISQTLILNGQLRVFRALRWLHQTNGLAGSALHRTATVARLAKRKVETAVPAVLGRE